MADNVPITAGSGTSIATDDVGGVQYQRVKVTYGTDGSATDASSTNPLPVAGVGNVAHDAVDSGAPTKIGAKAIAHGSNPSAVAAADRTDLYANRHGVLFVIGGHPNTITRSTRIADSDGAQADLAISAAVAAGAKAVVTAISVTCDAGNTNPVAIKVGFGSASIPGDSATGASGVLLDHEGIAPGSGIVIGSGAGILGVGADDEEVRFTCEDPVGGFVIVTISYFTIES